MKIDNSAYSHSNITGKKIVGTFQAFASSIQEPLSSRFTFEYMQVHACDKTSTLYLHLFKLLHYRIHRQSYTSIRDETK